MKKKMALLLAGTLLAGVLSGCGNQNGSSAEATVKSESKTEEAKDAAPKESDAEKSSEAKEEPLEWTGDTAHIVVTYLTLGTTPTDLLMVQDALNERTVKEIGVEVELKPVSAYDAMSQFPTWIATGESIDLMFPLLQQLNSYVNQGLIDPLEDLIKENAPYIQQLTDEGYTFASNNTIDGHIWSILQVPKVSGNSGGFVIADQYLEELEKAGISYDKEKQYTMDEMTQIFEVIKENHPNMYPCGLVSTTLSDTQFRYYDGIFDALGSNSYSGVVMGTDSTQVVNLFATEEYKAYLDQLREWYLAGYIHPDAATTDTNLDSQVASGVSCGYFMSSAPTFANEGTSLIRTTEIYQASQGAGGWVVPMTAKEPEAAIRFLNLMYQDESIANLIQWGIEGVHYTVLDADKNLIGFPEGVNADNSGYYNTLGLYGDLRKVYVWTETNVQSENDAYTEKAIKNPTKGVGMLYNPSDVSTSKITALAAAAAQYLPALESGSVDVDTYYQEFLDALEAAGIEDVIAEKQEQLDAFLTSK